MGNYKGKTKNQIIRTFYADKRQEAIRRRMLRVVSEEDIQGIMRGIIYDAEVQKFHTLFDAYLKYDRPIEEILAFCHHYLTDLNKAAHLPDSIKKFVSQRLSDQISDCSKKNLNRQIT